MKTIAYGKYYWLWNLMEKRRAVMTLLLLRSWGFLPLFPMHSKFWVGYRRGNFFDPD
jgi:hypothetical protein